LTPSLDLILTRPAQESQVWLSGLERAGHNAVNWPLIEIQPITNSSPLADQLERQTIFNNINTFAALVFVSSSSVEHFFKALQGATVPRTPCWVTGPGTAQALQKHGVPSQQIVSPPANAVQFDSPQLWEVTKNLVKPGEKVLFIRGSDAVPHITNPKSLLQETAKSSPSGSEWLMTQLRQKGVGVSEICVYLRCAPLWDEAQKQSAIETLDQGRIWIFSSSLSVQHLERLIPHQDWSRARALATHTRIAQCALEIGWGVVQVSRPTLSDVLTSLEYFY